MVDQVQADIDGDGKIDHLIDTDGDLTNGPEIEERTYPINEMIYPAQSKVISIKNNFFYQFTKSYAFLDTKFYWKNPQGLGGVEQGILAVPPL